MPKDVWTIICMSFFKEIVVQVRKFDFEKVKVFKNVSDYFHNVC